MKVKELEKFAHSAWSPLSCCRTYLAIITAEDCREPTVSNINGSITTPTLDIFEFNIKESSLYMQANISLQIKQKATCLLWTAPINSGHLDTGLLISGSVSGSLYLYDSQKIISSYQNALSAQMTDNVDGVAKNCMNSVKQSPVICITEQNMSNYLYSLRESVHNGVVRSLDFNRFQTNLFASASNDDEIFIWDVEKMEQPMLPDTKIQPLENLNQVAWNPRVQHILCSTSVSRCVIWDLRKSGPVLQLTKTMCQLEPQMMAWSPDVATRLCLADPNNPNADVQLWDLRYPKHMLSLLGHWPPNTTNSPLTGCPLGNAGTVNSLCWGIPECQKSMHKSHYYDKDMVVMTVGASGALPTINGNCGTKLNPTYAEMLVVWSVDQALNSPPDSVTAFQEATPEPIFVGRLEGLDDQELANPLCFNTLPTNASVHWIPNHPSLVCVTQSDGWITVYNLMSGINKQGEQLNIERYAKQRALAQNSQSLRNSHKVAEAFDDEQPLINFSNDRNNNNNINSINSLQSDSLYPVLMGEGNGNVTDNSQLNFGVIDQSLNDPNYLKSTSLSLPQPMPLLRVAPSWLKKPCGVHFAFGGRLVTFSSLINFQSNRTRTNSSMSSSAAPDAHHQHQLDSTEVHSNCVVIKWIDVFQLEPSSLAQSDKDRWKNSLQDAIECLISVLNCSNDYLKTVCENAKALFKTMVDDEDKCSLQTDSHLNLWNIIQARLDDPASVKSSLSRLLGYSKQDYQCFNESTSQLLTVLKNAIVTNDVKTVIQLCLHPKFSSLSLPNLSTLSVFAVLLTNLHRSEQGDLYEEVQSKLFHTLNDISLMQPTINEPVLNSVMMLLNCVLIRTNWITIAENWPLSDWKTILSAFVNHLWNQDVDLLRKLCSVFTKRLLDTTNSIININDDNNRITLSEAELAACICCIVGDDADGLTKCWLRLNNINENQLDNVTKCMPLAMLLLFLHRLSSSDHIQCTNISSRLLMNLAIWLAETRSGEQNESVILLALNLLTKTLSTVELYSQTMNNLIDLRHRLWCNLTGEQQQVLSAGLRQHFLCPYPHIQCRCGLSKTNSIVEMRPSLFNKSTQQHIHVLQQQQQQQPHLLSAQNSASSNVLLQQPTSSFSSIPSNVAVRNTTMNQHQPPNYPPLPFQSVQSPYVATSQNSFYAQHTSNDFSYPIPPPPLSVSDSVGVQSNMSGQKKPTFNISPNIPSPSNNSLSSVIPGVPFTSTSSSIVYPPLDLSYANAIKQPNVSSTSLMPSVVPPPLPNSCNYPSMNHYVQPSNSNPLGPESAFGNNMPNAIKPPLPPQPGQMIANFGHNIVEPVPSSFQPINNMSPSTPQLNVQTQQQMQLLLPKAAPLQQPPLPEQRQQQRQPMSPGWNDPPILTANQPRQAEAVSHNPYYNPMEFVNSSTSQPNSFSSQPSFPKPLEPQIPTNHPGLSSFTASNVPCPEPVQSSIPPMNIDLTRPLQHPSLPPSSSPYIQQQSLAPSVLPPSYPHGVYQRENHPQSHFQPSLEHNSTMIPSLLPHTPVISSNPYSQLGNIWPAAQPLSTVAKSRTAENIGTSNYFNAPIAKHDLQSSNRSDSTFLNAEYSLPAEFESMRKVLTILIENCRQVGDKQHRNKLVDVGLRLDQFFKNISTGQLQIVGAPMENLQICMNFIQSNDYSSALQQINLFIQSAIQLPDIQCFGPALKILMHTAKQLSPKLTLINKPTVTATIITTTTVIDANQ
ncbi:hypothetical protein MN116_008313 [Schistosoma mekongi]|uniref:Protein transport protein Sec31A n=1 Tax=Schistosoma mekongi TaxID=38744 RepID=A0AAE1Z6S7_SCHME|nr:hypothetical protein MN116_008313 [Schistosoma mekongi]